jgi:hypothetical protein
VAQEVMNIGRNSAEGRTLMLQDLERIHDVILDAYRALLMLGCFDVENTLVSDLPIVHPSSSVIDRNRIRELVSAAIAIVARILERLYIPKYRKQRWM